MKPYKRGERVGGLIQQVISDILRKDISDPRLAMATITGVKMSDDLKTARVYFSVSGDENRIEKASQGFESALGYIKRKLGSEITLRYMPKINFFYDESFDYGAYINKVLKSVNAENGNDYSSVEAQS
ncbi:Ribosome-binding factor [Desulfonema limicola]|uniref:Ribosome-binding factor A n=1 Tax=Desulfonema limicola TaxID=45656 RepID=A0A975B4H8_9BACT|nr:30S ribosome-binding factor RbfA [Desulfonema limicola]QTA78647.1 Ribosome-binding factor [Desulfonema limicola]